MFLIATVQIKMEYETHESYAGNTKHSNFMIIRTEKKLIFSLISLVQLSKLWCTSNPAAQETEFCKCLYSILVGVTVLK